MMLEMLYDWPTLAIVLALLGLMLAANEWGYRAGRRTSVTSSERSLSVSTALKGSVLALVALLLGFSFSATTTRYDLRRRLALDQANAIGTCYLRAGLLDDALAQAIRTPLEEYLDARLTFGGLASEGSERRQQDERISAALDALWIAVETANRAAPEAVRNSLIVPAANDVIDLSSTRSWANRNHLPEPVLILILVSVVISSFLLGHSSGQCGVRHFGLWLTSNVVFILVLYVILDFDRPHRGLIRTDLSPLLELHQQLHAHGP